MTKKPEPMKHKYTCTKYRAAAKECFHQDGELEIDDNAKVSLSDGGAYVAAWVWISDSEVEG